MISLEDLDDVLARARNLIRSSRDAPNGASIMATPNYLSRTHYQSQRAELEIYRKWVAFVQDNIYKSVASAYVDDEKEHEKHLKVVSHELSKALVALTNTTTELKKLERIGQ